MEINDSTTFGQFLGLIANMNDEDFKNTISNLTDYRSAVILGREMLSKMSPEEKEVARQMVEMMVKANVPVAKEATPVPPAA